MHGFGDSINISNGLLASRNTSLKIRKKMSVEKPYISNQNECLIDDERDELTNKESSRQNTQEFKKRNHIIRFT